MISEFDIKYVVRDHNLPPFKSITHIGGELSSGDRWQIPTKEAIEGIQSGRFAFTVTRDGNAPEQLVTERHGLYGWVLKSALDGKEPDALMAMPEYTPSVC